jgi:hypothetical protein
MNDGPNTLGKQDARHDGADTQHPRRCLGDSLRRPPAPIRTSAHRGQRATRAERALLAWLLRSFPRNRHVLDMGRGTGHLTQWLATSGLSIVWLERPYVASPILTFRLVTKN